MISSERMAELDAFKLQQAGNCSEDFLRQLSEIVMEKDIPAGINGIEWLSILDFVHENSFRDEFDSTLRETQTPYVSQPDVD